MSDEITGVWLVGALGGLATTVVVGATAIRRGLVARIGLASDGPEFDALQLPAIDRLIFGGHDVRAGDFVASAEQIAAENGSIPTALVRQIATDLSETSRELRPGTAINCGPAIARFAEQSRSIANLPLRDQVNALIRDLESFRERHRLTRVVVINVASTEPPIDPLPELETRGGLESLIDGDRRSALRASLLYAYAALRAGCPYINFTPSNAALSGGITAMADEFGLPYMGSDGKTGETLVKTTLAPMFRHRALRVLSWQGYNILGDRDGEVLSDDAHREAKVRSKDRALSEILGYPLHTHVGIDFVPSLKDLKTAWDFIHFEGFLGFKMSMQFTWQGCDAILAAPLVIDLARFAA
ncbi:MAG TPA: inositol-3-phosphate synthase, partial [Pirellulaceae bacterium]|nr:inositol-3-phosphate synthase [Pirellulaceae bacterium]